MTDGRTEAEEVPRRLALSFAGWLDNSGTPNKTFFEDALIVLDANVLLALYEIGADARREVLAALTGVVSRLWVPHQAALEFCQNRKRVVRDRTGYFKDIRRSLNKAAREAIDLLEATVKQVLDLREKNRTSRPWDLAEARLDRSGLDARLAGVMDSAIAELDALEAEHDLHPKDMQQADPLFIEIDQLLTGRIGCAPSRELLRGLVDEAISFRFPNEIPPGYKDAGKKTPLAAAGDYILWREVLNRATEQAATTHVLLVTSETKPDWWLVDERNRPLKARPELVQEMYEEARVELLLLSLADFLNGARDYLSLDVSDQTVAQLREVTVNPEHDDWQPDMTEPLDLLSLAPVRFEHLIRDLLSAMGYPEAEVISSSTDYGADLIVRDTRELVPSTIVVQAKRYRRVVDADSVRSIFGAMIHHNANGAIIFTTSWFSRTATVFAEGKSITLIDGAQLISLLKEYLDINAIIIKLNRDL